MERKIEIIIETDENLKTKSSIKVIGISNMETLGLLRFYEKHIWLEMTKRSTMTNELEKEDKNETI